MAAEPSTRVTLEASVVTGVVGAGVKALSGRLASRGNLSPDEIVLREWLLAMHLAQARSEFEAAVPLPAKGVDLVGTASTATRPQPSDESANGKVGP